MSRISALCAALVGVCALIGWDLGNEALKRIIPGVTAMNPTTATLIILAALAQQFIRPRPVDGPSFVRVALGIATASVGAIKFHDLVAGGDSGVDRFIFASRLAGPGTLNVNAMAPNTTICFVLIGAALALVSFPRRLALAGAQFCAFLTVLAALTAILGYAYGALRLYGLRAYVPMALNTAVCFLCIGVSVLTYRPRRAFMAILTNRTSGGRIARVLLPAVTAIPIFLGLFLVIGLRSRWVDPATGIALFVALILVLLAVAVLGPAGGAEAGPARRGKARQRGEYRQRRVPCQYEP